MTPKRLTRILGQKGFGLMTTLGISAVFGVVAIGLMAAVNSQQKETTRKRFGASADNINERIKLYLSVPQVCSQFLQGIDPVTNGFWPTTPRQITNPSDPSVSLLKEQDQIGDPQLTVGKIEIENYTPTDPSNPLVGTASLTIYFTGGNFNFKRSTPITAILASMVAADGTNYDGLSACQASANVPACPEGDVLTFQAGQLVCGSTLNLSTLANPGNTTYPDDPGDNPPGTTALYSAANILGQNTVTAEVLQTQLLTTAAQHDNGTGGVLLLQYSRTAKSDGLLRVVTNVPWRNWGYADASAIFGVIYAKPNTSATYDIAGEGLIGKGYEQVPGEINYLGSTGGTGTIYGEFPCKKGVTYDIQLRAMKYKFTNIDYHTMLGSIKNDDHVFEGFFEVYEISTGIIGP